MRPDQASVRWWQRWRYWLSWRAGCASAAALVLIGCPRSLAPVPAAERYNIQCVEHLHRGDLVEARVSCDHCLEFSPSHPECLSNLGLIHRGMGERNSAKSFFIRCLRANPTMAACLNNLGVLALDEAELERARQYFEAALRVNPDYAEARSNLGLVLFRGGQWDLAENAYRHLIAASPELSEPYASLGAIALQRQRPGQAIQWFQQALRLEPGYAAAWRGLALAHEGLGEDEEARRAWAACAEADPQVRECPSPR